MTVIVHSLLQALRMANQIAEVNKAFRARIAEALDLFRSMTSDARKARKEKKDKGKTPGSPA